MHKTYFDEMCTRHADLKRKLYKNMTTYQDNYKAWLKAQFKQINFFKRLSSMSLEAITYVANHEYLEEGQQLFKIGDMVDKIYILAEGTIETYVSVDEEDTELDKLKLPGCVMC